MLASADTLSQLCLRSRKEMFVAFILYISRCTDEDIANIRILLDQNKETFRTNSGEVFLHVPIDVFEKFRRMMIIGTLFVLVTSDM